MLECLCSLLLLGLSCLSTCCASRGRPRLTSFFTHSASDCRSFLGFHSILSQTRICMFFWNPGLLWKFHLNWRQWSHSSCWWDSTWTFSHCKQILCELFCLQGVFSTSFSALYHLLQWKFLQLFFWRDLWPFFWIWSWVSHLLQVFWVCFSWFVRYRWWQRRYKVLHIMLIWVDRLSRRGDRRLIFRVDIFWCMRWDCFWEVTFLSPLCLRIIFRGCSSCGMFLLLKNSPSSSLWCPQGSSLTLFTSTPLRWCMIVIWDFIFREIVPKSERSHTRSGCLPE